MDRKDAYSRVFLKAAGFPESEKDLKQFKLQWWHSLRDKEVGGLRLTDLGIEFVEKRAEIKTYKIDLPKELTINSQVLVWLDQYLDSPFHLTKKHITVLSERAAFELYLFSGDVKKMGLAKSLSKRIAQENQSSQP